MTTIPDESQVRDEVEQIAAGPFAERARLAEILVTLRVELGRLRADVAAIRKDLRAVARVIPDGSLRECPTCGELERPGQVVDGRVRSVLAARWSGIAACGTVQLHDGQRIEVDEAPAQRCRTCGRLKHFVRDGRCADCWSEGGHDVSER